MDIYKMDKREAVYLAAHNKKMGRPKGSRNKKKHRPTRDRSEGYKDCELCKIDCSKMGDTIEDVRRDFIGWYILWDCKYHKIKEKLPRLATHYCLEHKQFHCHEHREYCKKVYGSSVMDDGPHVRGEKSVHTFDAATMENEMCRMRTWEDQIEFGIIKCAECKSTVCECEYPGFGMLTVYKPGGGWEIHIDEQGDRKTKKIRDFSNYYENIDQYQKEYELVDLIMKDHYQKTGYSLNRNQVLKKLRHGEIDITQFLDQLDRQ